MWATYTGTRETKMKRRDFLNTLNSLMLFGAAGTIPGLSLYSRALHAADTRRKARFFVMIRATNGWDVTLGLDPKIHANGSDQNDMFIEYTPDQIMSAGALRFAPACAPLRPHFQDVATINGVFMSDANVSHDGNLDYISTGNSEGAAPDLAVELASATQVAPFGVLFDTTLKRANRVVVTNSTSNMLSLRGGVGITALERAGQMGGDSHSGFAKAKLNLLSHGALRTEFVNELDKLQEEIDAASSARRGGAVLAAAFTTGAAYQGMLTLSPSLDTHSAHEGTHLKEQTSLWEGVADIFRIFKTVPYHDEAGREDGSLFDRTTFMIVSEFSRTPALNAAKGKDHNPLTNSVLLAGAGVRGGTTIGESRLILRRNTRTGESRHVAGLINFETGQVARTKGEARAKEFQLITPENVVATVIDIFGVDRGRFASIPQDAASLMNLIR
jgi:uncharacterized protein (DUF1501 family)